VIEFTPEVVRELPVDKLAMAVLSDLIATKEWNEYNYLNSASQDKRYAADQAALHAIAEALYGYGKGKKNFVVLALGTGLGGGIFIDGKLYSGRGNAGELGHLNICPSGYKCSCGNNGCFEEYVSGKAIARYAKEAGFGSEDPKEIEDLARKGDKKAREIYNKAGNYLGIGVSSIIKSFDPEALWEASRAWILSSYSPSLDSTGLYSILQLFFGNEAGIKRNCSLPFSIK
jgi:predicted NBD/HSP70 family sugar kinase